MRDRDEWRRPWPDGPDGSGSMPGGTVTDPAVSGEQRVQQAWAAAPAQPTGDPRAEGVDGASESPADIAADTPVQPVIYGAPGDAVPAAATAAAATASRAPRGRRGGLAGMLGGMFGALATVLVLAAVGVIDTDGATTGGQGTPQATTQPAPPPPAPDRTPLPQSGDTMMAIPDAADRVLPSVVRVNSRSGAGPESGGGGLGSGVIYRADGYVVTNEHVIRGAGSVEVVLYDGEAFDAEVVGVDVLNDLAVLRIEARDLPAIALLPASEPVRVGETVIAIGSPFGFDATVTAGIVSALDRDLRPPDRADVIPGMIQTDAAINRGNSGGPLVDLQGRLVGINTMIRTDSGSNDGLGFAVPVRQAIVSSDQIIDQGFVRYPLLGVTGESVTPRIAAEFGLPDPRGALVTSVEPDSGAARAGMRTGDVIVAVDGIPLRTMESLVAEVRRRAPGMTVVLDVVRDGQELRIEVVLGERPRS